MTRLFFTKLNLVNLVNLVNIVDYQTLSFDEFVSKKVNWIVWIESFNLGDACENCFAFSLFILSVHLPQKFRIKASCSAFGEHCSLMIYRQCSALKCCFSLTPIENSASFTLFRLGITLNVNNLNAPHRQREA